MFMLRYVLRAGILASEAEATDIVVPDPRSRVESRGWWTYFESLRKTKEATR
jgi:hypothetical protein